MVSQTAADTGNPYVSVRFGNVLGSRGSVVPFFKDQIAAGGPITITHPDVERFFMTIPEAVQLVLQASALGSADDIFVLDMGEQIKIRDLAVELVFVFMHGEINLEMQMQRSWCMCSKRAYQYL